ncbi:MULTISPECIES: hypothetical protein [Burkholderia]|uniref:hypothetical protein n=1 Tax=Burkholderia TaxID=32008 RepID=UPI00265F915A|nr:hypothetical protein [Burkholderia sp. AU44665]MDN7703356.1 hypothetical protein [Burkholderia sp. AU44665]
MRELNITELELVSGATVSGDIGMALGGVAASAAAGAVAGVVFGGPAGGAVGGIVGAGTSIGYILSGGSFGRDDQAGTDYSGCDYH